MQLKITTFLILSLIFLFENRSYSQYTDSIKSDLSAWIDSVYTQGLDHNNIAGATIIVMQGDSVLHNKGYGLADFESQTPVNSQSSIFGIGSITKTFVATAIMQLYEEGKLALDRDVNNYLTSLTLEHQFNDSITIRHLLTHTAGLDLRSIGSLVRTKEDVIPLAQYLNDKMPAQIRPSGKVISYSNEAYALLGLIVEDVSGIPCDEYIQQNILQPLEMKSSSFKKQTNLKAHYATGYLQKGGQLVKCEPDFKLDYPAGGLKSTASDMGNYMSMYLNYGRFKGIQILDSTTVALMLNEPFRHYKKADYGWKLGFQEFFYGGISYYGHSGSVFGFESQLLIIPEKNIGIFISTNSTNHNNSQSRAFIDKFHYDFINRELSESIKENEEARVLPAVGSVAEPLEKFTGKYRSTFYGHQTLNKLAILIGLAPEIEIVAKDDNTLKVLQWNLEMQPGSDLTFHAKNAGYLAFDKDSKGDISYFFGQAYAYQKLKWYETVMFHIFWIGSIVIISLIYIVVSGGRKLFIRNRKGHQIKTISTSVASLIILFMALLAFVMMTKDPVEFMYGIPLLLKIALLIPFVIIALDVLGVYLLIKAVRFRELKPVGLVCQSLILVAACLFIPWLMYYNLIGFNY